jgi:glycine cleavage system regulatory protein
MAVHLVLTVIARDKPGIVEVLSQAVASHGANWLGSRMARLAGEFAGIVEVSVPEGAADALGEALAALSSAGLRVQVARSSAGEPGGPSRSLCLDLVGNDRPGIVREISQALARRGVNVDELVTGCESAAMSGVVLFRASARLRVPGSVTVEELSEELERIAADLMVDLKLDEPAP